MAKTARKSKGRTLAVVEVGEDPDLEGEKEEDAARGIPLFEGLGDEVKIEVYRMEPIEEGTIGTLAPDADEATIARRWGGGVYRVTAKGTDGRFGRRQRTVTIGGDPKFESKDATRKYRIKVGELPEDAAKNAPPPAPGLDVPGLLSIIQASHQNSMSFMQAQLAAQAQQAQQQVVASAKIADEGRQRDREFFATMLALQKQDQKQSDPLAMVPLLVKFLELGKDMAGGAGGGASDPVTAFIQGLPLILPQAQAMLTAGQAANQQQPPAPAPAPPPPAAAPEQGPRLVVTGKLAAQLEKTWQALRDKGYDSDTAMTIALEQLANVPKNPQAPEPPAPPEKQPPAPPPPAAAAAAPNETSPRARATRKR